MTTDLQELLAHIDPAGLQYDEWLAVGMAIQHEGGTAAEWDAWSRRDGKRHKEGECARKWSGFQGNGNPVTAGTLVELAKRGGWHPARNEGQALDWNDTVAAPHETLQFIDPGWVEEAEIEGPADWRPAQQLSLYLTTLFDASEHVGYVTNSFVKDGRGIPGGKGSYSRTAGEILQDLERYGDDLGMTLGDYDPAVGAWIRFNPLDGKGVRDDNVTAYRYALVESDTISIEKQRAIYEELELPVAVLVHSGGKSLHAIIRIDASNIIEYRERVNFLHKVCRENGLDIDTQNKNPSRLSRLPGVVRGENKQFIVATNTGRESWEAWKEFVEEANDNLPDFEPLESVFHDLPELKKPLIEGVLREGHKMLLAGPSKAGKSWMLLQLVIAFAEGREWLGWQCAQGRVLYVNLELDRVSCLHRIRDLYAAHGWQPSNLANIDLWHLRGKAVPMDHLAPKLIRRAAKRNYKAIIIDPIYKVITGDENAADKMAFFCNQFDRVCSELGAAVIYCHHHSKGSQGQKSARDRSSGSGVFARDPDAILDIIELDIPPDARKAVSDRAVCDALAAELDKAKPVWLDEISQDDALIADKILEYAKGKVDAVAIAERVRAQVKRHTGWRLEGSLREFPTFDNRCFWFRHPIHIYDEGGVLGDAKAAGEEAPWAAEQRKKRAERATQADKVKRGFELASFATGAASLEDLVGQTGLEEDKVKRSLKTAGLVACDDGMIRRKAEAEAMKEAASNEAAMALEGAVRANLDDTGGAPLEAVAKALGLAVPTLKKNLGERPRGMYRKNNRIWLPEEELNYATG